MAVILLLLVLYSIFYGIILNTSHQFQNKRRMQLSITALLFASYYFIVNLSGFDDVPEYRDYFNHIDLYNLQEPKFEIGWFIINKVFHSILPDFGALLFMLRLIQIAAFIVMLKRYSNNIWMASVIILCSSYFSLFILRQYIAIAICIFSLPLIEKRKFWWFVILTLIAANIHNSAYIWLFSYFLFNLKFNFKSITIFIVALFVFSDSLESLFNILVPFFLKIDIYRTDITEQGSWKSLIVSAIYFLFALSMYARRIKKIDQMSFLFFLLISMALFFDIINNVGSSFNQFHRIITYFSIYYSLVLPKTCSYIKNGYVKMIVVFAILIIYLYGMYSLVDKLYGYRL